MATTRRTSLRSAFRRPKTRRSRRPPARQAELSSPRTSQISLPSATSCSCSSSRGTCLLGVGRQRRSQRFSIAGRRPTPIHTSDLIGQPPEHLNVAARHQDNNGVESDDPIWLGIIEYVRSCHNDAQVNTREEVTGFLEQNSYCLSGDGGIVATMENFRRSDEEREAHRGAAPEPIISSGNSTYQGIRTYLRAGLGPESPEVASALAWVRRHYSVTEHMGFADIMRAGQRPLWLTEHPGFAELDTGHEHQTVIAEPPRRAEEMGGLRT
jgi:hypothetical protein